MLRKFRAHVSDDRGNTWHKTRAVGWVINDIKGVDGPTGYVVAIDIGDMMVDVELPARILKLILKDVKKVAEDAPS